MIGNKREQHVIHKVFPMLLFLLFAFCSICLLMLSVLFYRNTLNRGEQTENLRVVGSYIRESIRRNSTEGAIEIGQFQGSDCLVLNDAEEYTSYIYCHDGMLRELYIKEGVNVTLADGKAIAPLEDMEMEFIDDRRLKITCYMEEDSQELLVHIVQEGVMPNEE